jgi:hypothetical protein
MTGFKREKHIIAHVHPFSRHARGKNEEAKVRLIESVRAHNTRNLIFLLNFVIAINLRHKPTIMIVVFVC